MNIIKPIYSRLFQKKETDKQIMNKIYYSIYLNKPEILKKYINKIPDEFYTLLYIKLGSFIQDLHTFQTKTWINLYYKLSKNALDNIEIRKRYHYSNEFQNMFIYFLSIINTDKIDKLIDTNLYFFKVQRKIFIYYFFEHDNVWNKFQQILKHVSKKEVFDSIFNHILTIDHNFEKKNHSRIETMLHNFDQYCSTQKLDFDDILCFYYFFINLKEKSPDLRRFIMNTLIKNTNSDTNLQFTAALLGNKELFEEALLLTEEKTNFKEDLNLYLSNVYLGIKFIPSKVNLINSKTLFDYIYDMSSKEDVNQIFSKQIFINMLEEHHVYSFYMFDKFFEHYENSFSDLLAQKHLGKTLLSVIHKDNLDYFSAKIAQEEYNILAKNISQPFKKDKKRL